MTNTIKVAITGGAGQIGYALLYRIANGDMFGPNQKIDLHLIELEASLPALNGVAMELDDCAFPLLNKVICTSSLDEGMNGANWVILVGAVPRKAGMERADLLGINGKIFTAQGQAINNNASEDVRVLVVGNPCNTNCYIAMKNAPDVPNDRFYAMTMLDEKRARAQLAIKAGVDITQIAHMNIWGNHSATQYPDFYNATIGGQSALSVIGDEAWLQTEFVSIIQKRGAAVIAARGSSSAASAANAIISSVSACVNDTPVSESYSMCVASQGQYGVDEDLIFSFPCRTEKGQLRVIDGIEHNAFAKEKLRLTLEELRAERDTVKSLGLVS